LPRRLPRCMVTAMNNREQIDVQTLFAGHPFARVILDRLGAAGHEAVLIGGVVRDGLRSLWGDAVMYPPADVDIATSALPAEIRSLFAGHPIVGVGEEFGVIVIVSPDGRPYEVATYRVEGEYDGRWPSRVELVRDLAGDVRRRDLTINGLAASLDGDVIDLVGGMDDLKARRVRAIGDPSVRFAEDYLRMLRAVRFACQIDASLDGPTAEAISAHAEGLTAISGERIRDELLRILATPRGCRGVELLDQLGLLDHVLPELGAGKGVPQPEAYHPEGDVFEHTLAAMRVADTFVRDPIVKLAVLLHDIGKPQALARNEGANMGGHCALGAWQAKRIAHRLRLSRADTGRLTFLVKNHMRIADFPEMGRGKQVLFLTEAEVPGDRPLGDRYPRFVELLQVLVADCEASAHRAAGWEPILAETLRVVLHVERVGNLRRARDLVDGHDLSQLGLRDGPEMGRVLRILHDRILAGEVGSRDEALEAARSLLRGDHGTFGGH
jgi:tRNA nucleotidyltransferase/poly(A) polymerase